MKQYNVNLVLRRSRVCASLRNYVASVVVVLPSDMPHDIRYVCLFRYYKKAVVHAVEINKPYACAID